MLDTEQTILAAAKRRDGREYHFIEGCLCRLRNFFDSSCVSSTLLVTASSKRASSLIAGSKRRHPYDTPSSEHELCDSRPYNWSRRWAGNIRAWRGKGCQNSKDGNSSCEITTYCIESKKLESRRTEVSLYLSLISLSLYCLVLQTGLELVLATL